jgi:ubiquinone/menaquinone biosynthesis C-methylase UbiE
MDEKTAKAVASQLRKPEGDDGVKIGKWMNDGNAAMNRDVIRVLNAAKDDKILEIGMGNGFFIGDIVSIDPSIQYTGLDYSETMVTEAKKLNQKWIDAGQVKFIHGNIENIPGPADQYNKIFTVNTIYFWENEIKVLEELKRVLKPGGLLIIAIRPRRLTKDYPFTKFGFRLYEKEDLVALLATAGFSIQVFEHEEPDFEKDGEKMKMENVVAVARKPD